MSYQTFKLKNGREVHVSMVKHPHWADSTSCDWCGKTIRPDKPKFLQDGSSNGTCSLAHAKAHMEFHLKATPEEPQPLNKVEQEYFNSLTSDNTQKNSTSNDIDWSDMFSKMKQDSLEKAKEKRREKREEREEKEERNEDKKNDKLKNFNLSSVWNWLTKK